MCDIGGESARWVAPQREAYCSTGSRDLTAKVSVGGAGATPRVQRSWDIKSTQWSQRADEVGVGVLGALNVILLNNCISCVSQFTCVFPLFLYLLTWIKIKVNELILS